MSRRLTLELPDTSNAGQARLFLIEEVNRAFSLVEMEGGEDELRGRGLQPRRGPLNGVRLSELRLG